MKLSQFNNHIPLSNNKTLGYNSFQRRFIVLPEKVASIIKDYDSTINSEEIIDRLSAETFQLLKESGSIINSYVDELSILDKELETINCCESNAELHINPTLDCNFLCWYCYEEHMAGSNYTLGNLESVSEIISDLKAQNIVESNKIVIDFQRVWQDKHKGGDEKIKLLIKEYGRQLKEIGISYSLPDLHNPRVSSCYGDKKNYICVNYNGDFYKCTARDFKPERRAGHLAPDGTLVWEPGRREAWEKAKFSREICRSCRIAPICLGGCRQRELESPDDGRCPLGYDEARKDELILQRFEHQYLND